MQPLNLDVVATRGPLVESRHHVHAAVVDGTGRLVASAGDPTLVAHSRSCAKPFQVMPFIEDGGFDGLRWGDDQLALACASHGGEPEHVAIASSMLDSIDLEEGDLACGPHDPLTTRGQRILRESGERPTRLHNNCSGKHAAMLAHATTAGWPAYGYERAEHEVQRVILRTLAVWASVPEREIRLAVDGCGVVVFILPLDALARAYGRFATVAEERDAVARRIAHAMATRPFLVGGTDRFDTLLIEETNGRVISKVGAEGIHAVALRDQGLGLAVKVEDGASRAQHPAVLRALQQLGALPDPLPPRLQEFLRRPLRNTRGEVVGEVMPVA